MKSELSDESKGKVRGKLAWILHIKKAHSSFKKNRPKNSKKA
jgi:hypothetical protein